MSQSSFSIYNASAGSGKTYTLVQRYLTIVLRAPNDDAYRHILAITFTNKAVNEMKARVVDTLTAFAADITPSNHEKMLQDIAQEIGLSEPAVKLKAKKIIKHIIHNYAGFDISTIDKFTHRVIRAFAHDLAIPVTFEVSVETDHLLAEAVDALIAQAGEEQDLTRLLVDFALEKTDDDKSWDITRELLETGKLILNENDRNEVTHFKDHSIASFMAEKKKVQLACKQIEAQAIAFAKDGLQQIAAAGIDDSSFYRKAVPDFFRKNLGGVLTANPDLVEKHLLGIEPQRYAAKVPAAQQILVDQLAKPLAELIEQINAAAKEYVFYRAFLKNITPLSLLNSLEKQVAQIQQEQNMLSITAFNKLINDQIKEQPAPFIYERLGDRYRHFFIDEFQDTSELQWDNLIPLIDNATSSEVNGQIGTAMIVGDPKQSIYRWRGGKAEQFIALIQGNNPFNNKERRVEHLETNHRSFSEVIQFNNHFFKEIGSFFAPGDYRELYQNQKPQNTTKKIGGFVNISFISNQEDPANFDRNQAYIDRTLAIIEEVLQKGFTYAEIAVLTRTRAQGVVIARALVEQKIQIISSETLQIANATEVRFILHALRYVHDSADKEAKANMLHYLALQFNHQGHMHDFIASGLMQIAPVEFDVWLQSKGIALSCVSLRKKGLYQAAECIISACIKERNNAYIQYFLDVILERESKGIAGIADFLNFWEQNNHKYSIPTPESENAVRIMTIHKAKGLEFPIVILPFAEEEINRKPKEKLWIKNEKPIIDLPKVLIDNTSAVEHFGGLATTLFNQKKQEILLDTVNVLYVALTRAVEQLYVISELKLDDHQEPPKDNVCTYFISYLKKISRFKPEVLSYDFGSPKRVSEKRQTIIASKIIQGVNELLPITGIAIARKDAAMWGSVAQQAIDYGNLIHEIMSRVKKRADITHAVQLSLELGLITTSQQQDITKTLVDIVNHPMLIDFFHDELTIMNEQPILTKDGVLKPDRVGILNKNAFLLDYKTGMGSPKHEAQLEAYGKALESMGYQVINKVLVYLNSSVDVIQL